MTNNLLNYLKTAPDDPFEPMMENAPIMMHSIDQEGRILQVSRFWASKLGYTPEEMVGRQSSDFLTDASRKKAIEDILPQFYKTGSVYNVEYDFVRKDGTEIPVLLSASASLDENGKFVRSLAIIFDNSAAKRSAAALIQSQRTDAIGQLVGGVAHDFNNLLTVIQGNLEFLRSDPDSSERMSFIDDALRATSRGASLTQQLLAYGRRSHLMPKQIDLNRAVREMDSMMRRVIPASISIQTVEGGGLWTVNVDRHQLDTAILNIVNNACDAMPNSGGKLTIETCNVRISEAYVTERYEDIVPGRYVMLAISDNGHGMGKTIMGKVFEPFYTTKAVGKGSGLGLSMVFGFLKQSKGSVRIYSEVGVGTTFKLYFPAVSGSDQPSALDQIQEEITGYVKSAKILVVEDEPDVRNVIVRQLSELGLGVAQAASGDEAFAMLAEGYRPEVMLTDIVMPGALQGPELAREARKMIDGIKVIFISGYPKEATIHGNGVSADDIQFVKPVSKNTLLKGVTELLNKDV